MMKVEEKNDEKKEVVVFALACRGHTGTLNCTVRTGM
jgi:hypothetical protein